MAKSYLSQAADEDLLSIFRYTIDTWGVEHVPIYLGLLEAGRDKITSEPFVLGSKSREDLAEDCRTYRVGKHYFVYRIRDEVVEIGRVLHESMDFNQQVDEAVFK